MKKTKQEMAEASSAYLKSLWSDPEFARKVSKKMSKTMKERWADPVWREMMMKKRKAQGVRSHVMAVRRKAVEAAFKQLADEKAEQAS
jgi:hypothetical protein